MSTETKPKQLTESLQENIAIIKEIFKQDETIVYREFENAANSRVKCCLINTKLTIGKEMVNDMVMRPIMQAPLSEVEDYGSVLNILRNRIIYSFDIEKASDADEIAKEIIYGNSILLVEGCAEVLIINTIEWTTRAVDEPESERNVRGPREGFTEAILTNLSLIRRNIKNPDLKFVFKECGTVTKTRICISYIEGIVNPKILQELYKRLEDIEMDGILGSNYIEEWIRDAPFSIWNTTGYTERPDVVAGKLLEGRIAIICDGTPSVVTVPYLFIEGLQANEDYYDNFLFASFNRLLRWIGFILTTGIPAIYVALVAYHQEMIPTTLLLSISAARTDVPLPTIAETIVMLFVFEVLRESGIRLPTPIGQAISIVGALVLGEAAVQARVISSPIVIVIALTGITSFLIPKMLSAVITVRILLLLAASFLGLYGYIFVIIGLGIHLHSLRSFGVPYMLELGDYKNLSDLKDTAIRAPWWVMKYRPKLIASRNRIRQTIKK